MTNVTVVGQLAATRELDCLALTDVRPSYTPPDLYTGVARCVVRGDFPAAARLSIVALTFARFDAERVTDVSARDAGQMIALSYGSTLAADARSQLQQTFTTLVGDVEQRRAICDRLAAIGPPDYIPTYMILHGIETVARRINGLPDPAGGSLVAGFDAPATWDRLQKDYIHCP